ncbi:MULTISPECIES: FAD-binding protein [unclassified Chelatococcus]|uniref:FAD-dependent oxidoreductase n=1 Tax=unclassified Chelatococcus TaxID=2638111 RepID=UPI001BCB7819|nr:MULTISPECIES: FAD-binding protein [unclassified Chelatococcus]CAH1650194.1 hypothetical protein CHELA20_10498 [Hyphomicrobiales bacterium]MBS7743339.1 FAD-binding protein [Chelatococcus sp. HY11]MBX3541543.1 FAD-binding protein [Chelatococcus sp.]MCO5074565.1 FAD-binding protein [Chelatococcus sp.]CAH1692488.1 hypothetical protein CHELA41_50725 [Hyphomicrobiales bacterium]
MAKHDKAPASDHAADVLVVGGGPAACWAALTAALAGASVILVDKGYVGTSGATAPSTTGVWFAADERRRDALVERRLGRACGLGDGVRMARIVEVATEHIKRLAEWGYPFPRDDEGNPYLANLRGPDYLRFMRRQLLLARVRILDHHPALELLAAGDGIGGASGVARQNGTPWTARAGAVVLATGGCAFGDRILGATGLTGDAYLMGAEAGVRFSGMEFSAQYGIAPLGSAVNKGISFTFASFFREDGTPIHATVVDRYPPLARAMADGPVFATFDLATPAIQDALRRGSRTASCRSTVSGSIPSRNASASTFAARGRFGGPAGFGPTGAAPRMCPVSLPPAIPWIGRISPARPRAEVARTPAGRSRPASRRGRRPPSSAASWGAIATGLSGHLAGWACGHRTGRAAWTPANLPVWSRGRCCRSIAISSARNRSCSIPSTGWTVPGTMPPPVSASWPRYRQPALCESARRRL